MSSLQISDKSYLSVGSIRLDNADTYEALGIVAFENNFNENVSIHANMYRVVVKYVDLNTNSPSVSCDAQKYTFFQIPYNPFPGVKIPPRINITITITPSSSCQPNKPTLAIYYTKESWNPGKANIIQASDSMSQSGGCDILNLTISSDGPFEYFSIYNSDTSSAPVSVTITVLGTPAHNNNFLWWYWLLIGGCILGLIIIVVAVIMANRHYYGTRQEYMYIQNN